MSSECSFCADKKNEKTLRSVAFRAVDEVDDFRGLWNSLGMLAQTVLARFPKFIGFGGLKAPRRKGIANDIDFMRNNKI